MGKAVKSALPLSISHVEPLSGDQPGRLVARVTNHLEAVLAGGTVQPGGRLPSERTVALDLHVSRNTVAAAYGGLEERGLIRRMRGKGAFMCNPRVHGELFSWSGKISATAHLLDEPVLEMLARNGASKVPYPLSAGTPSLACFPHEMYKIAVNKVLSEDLPGALAVAPTEGQHRLRNAIASWTAVEPSRVLITSGAQEGIDLLARCLIEPGEVAIVEAPAYPGVLQCLRAAGARLVEWSTDWSLEELEQLIIRHRPKLIFTTPTFQNPTGRVMSLSTREGLLDLARRYYTPIIEDDVYAHTYLDQRPGPPSLVKLDRHSQVIYIGTFSKMLAPGLRIGWVVAPKYMVKQLSLMKMRANLFTGGLNQLVLANLLESGNFDRHLVNLRRQHALLRNAAVSAAQQLVDEDLITFSRPTGGLYLWCRAAGRIDFETFYDEAAAAGVSVAPGQAFFAKPPQASFFRICFTAAPESQLRKAIARLHAPLRLCQSIRIVPGSLSNQASA
jgi:DNA-binding transcriptional MocR family regulator